MKRFLAVLLAALLVLTAAVVSAEETPYKFLGTVGNQDVTLVCDNVNVDIVEGLPTDVVAALLTRDGAAPVILTVVPSELYVGVSLADLDQAAQAELLEQVTDAYENPVVELTVTPSGNQYYYICSGEGADIDVIFTLYRGFVVELDQYNEDLSELTDADHAFANDVLYGLEFLDAVEPGTEDGNPPMSMDLYLKANPSTGYSWTGVSSNEAVAVVVDNGFYTGEAEEGMTGVPGYAMLRIDGLSAGAADITLSYGRAGEEPLYTLSMAALVDEAGNVFVYGTTYTFD